VLVTLLEEFEMARYAIPDLRAEVMRAGLRSLWLPIPDMSVPDSMEDVAALVTDFLDRMAAGDTVVVHCLGGLGRSGTIAACCLVARGLAPAKAIAAVRAARPGAVEVESQVRFVERFGGTLGAVS
jgi:protein-tyrosine phosphatase